MSLHESSPMKTKLDKRGRRVFRNPCECGWRGSWSATPRVASTDWKDHEARELRATTPDPRDFRTPAGQLRIRTLNEPLWFERKEQERRPPAPSLAEKLSRALPDLRGALSALVPVRA